MGKVFSEISRLIFKHQRPGDPYLAFNNLRALESDLGSNRFGEPSNRTFPYANATPRSGGANALVSGKGISLSFPNPTDFLLIATMIVVPIFCVYAFTALLQVAEAHDIVERLYPQLKDRDVNDLSDVELQALNLGGKIRRERLNASRRHP